MCNFEKNIAEIPSKKYESEQKYGKDSSELERMDYLEFIARVSSHIPDKGQVMIRYYGLSANAHRGKMSKVGVLPSHPPNSYLKKKLAC